MRLSFATELALCVSASVAPGYALDVSDASCLVCHRRWCGEHYIWDVIVHLRVGKSPL